LITEAPEIAQDVARKLIQMQGGLSDVGIGKIAHSMRWGRD